MFGRVLSRVLTLVLVQDDAKSAAELLSVLERSNQKVPKALRELADWS